MRMPAREVTMLRCTPLGYLGIEAIVVQRIGAWIQ
jgi:hypothetical protein